MVCCLIGCKKNDPKPTPVITKKAPAIILTDERKVDVDTALLGTFKSETLKQFYSSSENKTVWNLKKRQYVITQLEKSEELGLNPEDYKIEAA